MTNEPNKKEPNKNVLKQIKPVRVILPTLLGIGVVVYLLMRDFHPELFNILSFSWGVIIMMIFAFLMMFTRDFGYILRLRILSEKSFSWKQSFRIIMLWEFASTVTPSAIGGTGLATYFLWKEGFSAGKSASVVMATSFLDELYFALMFPILFFVFYKSGLFVTDSGNILDNRYFFFAIAGYSLKLTWCLIMAYALFIKPKSIKRILLGIFKLKILKKWKNGAQKAGDDIIMASDELKTKSIKFWLKAFTATFFSWTARYWVLNFLLLSLAFGLPNLSVGNLFTVSEHFLIFARQLVMWIMMMVMPTPGGSGFVEVMFSSYMADIIPIAGFMGLMVMMWRLVTYYPYLFLGIIIAPRWLSRKRKTQINN
ncbi:MAG TPA: lysylphosphatidylglycerol synthase transmembrane domain-containing protein [Bacteroidales bacterium]|nr:lysylphosphatidylglycerol synthase transmembrane domain-containing protein [Bacteroidales bacterium]